MNQERRSTIADIQTALGGLKSQVEDLQGAEQEAFDNLPEAVQQGDSGQKMEAAIEALGSALDAIDETTSYLDSAAE